MFSSAVVVELSRRGRSCLLLRLASEAGYDLARLSNHSVGEFFDTAFDRLRRVQQRNEYVYRTAMIRNLLLGRHSLRTATMLSEFRVGGNKADLVILNGTSTGYEIKSERDSLSRLTSQISSYQRVFAKTCVIAAEKHLPDILSGVPEVVGVLKLSRWNRISAIREPIDCSSCVDPLAILDSLRSVEAIEVLELLGRKIPDVPNIRMRAALSEEFSHIEPTSAHGAMVATLRRTRTLQAREHMVASTPYSLKAAALTYPIRRSDYGRFLESLSTPMSVAKYWVPLS